MSLTGMPDVFSQGIRRIHLLTASYFFPGGNTSLAISRAQILATVPSLMSDANRPFVLDIEEPRYTSIASDPEQEGLNNAMDWTREAAGEAIIAGFYTNTCPERTYWGNQSEAGLANWQATNDAVAAKIINTVDFLNPSIYTFYSPEQYPIDDWVDYATRMLTEARRLATGGQKVIAWLWPFYHTSNPQPSLRHQPIPGYFWKKQLETCQALADHIAIFAIPDPSAGFNPTWDDDWEWWQETLTFLENL